MLMLQSNSVKQVGCTSGRGRGAVAVRSGQLPLLAFCNCQGVILVRLPALTLAVHQCEQSRAVAHPLRRQLYKWPGRPSACPQLCLSADSAQA